MIWLLICLVTKKLRPMVTEFFKDMIADMLSNKKTKSNGNWIF